MYDLHYYTVFDPTTFGGLHSGAIFEYVKNTWGAQIQKLQQGGRTVVIGQLTASTHLEIPIYLSLKILYFVSSLQGNGHWLYPRVQVQGPMVIRHSAEYSWRPTIMPLRDGSSGTSKLGRALLDSLIGAWKMPSLEDGFIIESA